MPCLIIMGLLRVIRRWNQTGQKFAGEPDIAKAFLLTRKSYLWIAVTSTYVGLTYVGLSGIFSRRHSPSFSNAIGGVVSMSLGLAALTFKLAFVNNDAPELLHGFPQLLLYALERQSLEALARTVFLGLLATAIGITFLQWRKCALVDYRFEFG
jgi:ethanolaminephosphotransferase